MKKLRGSVVSFVLVVLVSFFAFISLCPFAEAEECTATVSADMNTVHVPAVQFNGRTYSGDMKRVPSNDGIIWFEATAIQPADDAQCENPALFSDFSGTNLLVAPTVSFGGNNYQAVLEYVPGDTAASSKTAAAPTNMRLKVTNITNAGNSSGLAGKVPQTLYFDSSVKAEVIDGGFEFNIGVQSKVTLGEWLASLDPNTGTSFYFGAATSTLSVLNATCEYTDLPPDVSCSCVVKTVGSGGDPYASGWFTINSLSIEHGETASPAITMNYSLGLFASSVTVNGQCCGEGGCSDVKEVDYSNVFFHGYQLLHQSEYVGDAFVAAGNWAAVATPFYAMKNYPERQVELPPYLMYSGHTQIRLMTR